MADQSAAPVDKPGGRSLPVLKQDYLNFLDLKVLEIREQQEARRYFHGSQWTKKQIDAFNRRKQPVVTFNRTARKINAIVGLLERQRQDPKAYPRTPRHEEGADVATAVLRYVLDEQRWKEKSPNVGLGCAIDGIGGIELTLVPGDLGDTEVGFETVDTTGFFYDPRSTQPDFSDAGYMGIGKWADEADLIAAFPDKREEIAASINDAGSELTTNPDSDIKWISGDTNHRRIRLVDHWYKVGRHWFWCIYTGSAKLADGPAYVRDEKQNDLCKYIMFSANVDQDGDRYGFVRNMKSSQDEINQRRSKGLHILNSRRVIMQDGQGIDVEKVRHEAARPDGVVLYPPGMQNPPEFDDGAKGQELQGHLGFLQEAKEEIENYGFNPALMGSGVQDMSGRAIALQQQAGIAELGPFILGYKGWKLRVYRAIWAAVQEHWTAERWIRVTDDEDLAQWLSVNRLGIDPQTGQPTITNDLGSLDVDIILDEGPDVVNLEADMNETLKQILPAIAPMLNPPQAQAALSMLVSTSSLPASAKLQFKQASQQQQPPNPLQIKSAMLDLEGKAADNQNKRAETQLKLAKAYGETQGQIGADPAQLEFDRWHALLESWTQVEVARIAKNGDADAAMIDARLEAFLGLSGLASDQVMQLRDHAHQRIMAQLQPPAPAAA
jgi:hypothetical protein